MNRFHQLAAERRRKRAERSASGICIVCGVHQSRENRRSCSECGRTNAARQRKRAEVRDCPKKQVEAIKCNPEAWYMTFDAGCPTMKSLYN
jgi:hypothetical protein